MSDKGGYILWGSAGHAKVVAELIGRQQGKVVALFDNNLNTPSSLQDVPVYYGETDYLAWLARDEDALHCKGGLAIGGARGKERMAILGWLQSTGMQCPPLIHDQAVFSAMASIGDGSQVLALSLVAAGSQIGQACIINHGANVDHECSLGDGVHIAPGAKLCGLVSVGDFSMVGAGAVVLPRIHIGQSCIVGAGAVVTKDVPDGVVVAGNPARVISII